MERVIASDEESEVKSGAHSSEGMIMGVGGKNPLLAFTRFVCGREITRAKCHNRHQTSIRKVREFPRDFP